MMRFQLPHHNTVSSAFSIAVQNAVEKEACGARRYLAEQYGMASGAFFQLPDDQLENYYQAILYRIANRVDLSAQEKSDAQYLTWLCINQAVDRKCKQCGHSHILCRCCDEPLPCNDTGYDGNHVCDDCMRFTVADDENGRASDE